MIESIERLRLDDVFWIIMPGTRDGSSLIAQACIKVAGVLDTMLHSP